MAHEQAGRTTTTVGGLTPAQYHERMQALRAEREQSDTCDATVDASRANGWKYHTCGRPAKRHGLCGIHARSAEKWHAEHSSWTECRVCHATNQQVEGGI